MKRLNNIYVCFPEGKHKCLTMSYDDGREFDKDMIEFFNEVGIKGTFHLNGGLLGDNTYGKRIEKDDIPVLYKGHEISGHTFTHPTIERCPLDQVVLQVLEDRQILEELSGYPVRGLSYPNGSYSKDIINLLPACGIEYARTVNSTHSFGMPVDYLEWNPTCHHADPRFEELADTFIIRDKTQYLYLLYVWGHSYEFEGNDTFDRFKATCRKLANRKEVWYATNIEIVDYMKAAKNLKFTSKGDKVYNMSALDIWLDVNKKIVKVPSGALIELDKI